MIFSDGLCKNCSTGVLVGIGLALAAPILMPALGAVVRPLTKELIKGYLTLSEKMTDMMAEVSEQFNDVVAEVLVERADAARSPPPGSSQAQPPS